MRRWPAAAAGLQRLSEIAPNSVDPKIGLAYLGVFRGGDPVAGRQILQNISSGVERGWMYTQASWDLAMLDRDYAAAEMIATDSPLQHLIAADGAGAPRAFIRDG